MNTGEGDDFHNGGVAVGGSPLILKALRTREKSVDKSRLDAG
jgi:hypothetical protein